METVITKNSSISIQNTSLSEQIIPAVPGEFYSYASDFSIEYPLYGLMKCKSNKKRSISPEIMTEIDLAFIFGNEVILCSPDSKLSIKLVKEVIPDLKKLNHTEIRIADITEEIFYDCSQVKSGSILVDIYRNSSVVESDIVLSSGLIISVKTDSGKYGLILIKELSTCACMVNACHILL